MKIIDIYWRAFNFMARRVVAGCFFFGGLIIAGSSIDALFPGGSIVVDGQPTTDIAVRIIAVAVPALMALAGVLLFRSKPYNPQPRSEASPHDT